jgi:hypothetical protein
MARKEVWMRMQAAKKRVENIVKKGRSFNMISGNLYNI